jgi:hypothetical protein
MAAQLDAEKEKEELGSSRASRPASTSRHAVRDNWFLKRPQGGRAPTSRGLWGGDTLLLPTGRCWQTETPKGFGESRHFETDPIQSARLDPEVSAGRVTPSPRGLCAADGSAAPLQAMLGTEHVQGSSASLLRAMGRWSGGHALSSEMYPSELEESGVFSSADSQRCVCPALTRAVGERRRDRAVAWSLGHT